MGRRLGGWRLLLLLGGICAWSPRESASSLGFCGRQLPCAPHDRVLRRRVADEAQAATIAELTEKLSQPEDFEVGQNVSGRVMATQFRGPSLAYVDIGADKDAVLEYGEMEDGFPTKRDPVRKGKQISARILEFNEEADRFYLTMRSGDLSRPPRIKKSEENHDPESLRLVASEEWLDAEAARKNQKLAAKALNADPDMIRFLHPDLLKNEAFLMPHVAKNGLLLKYVRLRSAKMASAAVEQNPLALEFCKKHHITETMVMTAVGQNGLALRFVPAQFAVRQVVLAAVCQDPRAVRYVGDKALMLDAVREYPHALKFAWSKFLADADVVSAAFEKDKTSLRYATKPAVLELISRYPHEDLLQLAKDSLQKDVDVLSAVQPLCKAKNDFGDRGSAEATVAAG